MNDNFSELKDMEKDSSIQPNWIMGAVLITVGGLLLLRNFTGFEFENWWALFMFIPLGGIVTGMWAQYQANGRISTGLLLCGLGFLFAITVFLFNLSWGALWPIYFIFGGIAALLGSRK